MMCYKDREFCTGDGCAKFERCPRALTQEVRAATVRWWGSEENVPLAVCEDPTKLECYELNTTHREDPGAP